MLPCFFRSLSLWIILTTIKSMLPWQHTELYPPLAFFKECSLMGQKNFLDVWNVRYVRIYSLQNKSDFTVTIIAAVVKIRSAVMSCDDELWWVIMNSDGLWWWACWRVMMVYFVGLWWVMGYDNDLVPTTGSHRIQEAYFRNNCRAAKCSVFLNFKHMTKCFCLKCFLFHWTLCSIMNFYHL